MPISVLSRFTILALLLTAVDVNVAVADEVYARIRGVVTDPAEAVLPGAKVTVTNVDTGVSHETTTDPTGGYEFLSLPIGTYRLVATKSGFRTFRVTGITLVLNQIYVQNIRMEIGVVTETVEVQAFATQVESTSSQLGTVISGDIIRSLPLINRNWIELHQLQPGVVASSDRFTNNFATNGGQTQQNSYLINGMDSNDLPLNTPLVIPSPDAIAEFTLVTGTINPEYGRNSGAIINAVIRSGTNSFHGSAFESYRDTFMNAKNFFRPKPEVFHRNFFGGTVGGPVIKNHTFFFFSYQGFRSRALSGSNVTTATPGTATVFTQAERNGFFPALATATNTSPFPMVGEDGITHPANTPYNVLFPTGHIPAVDLNSVAKTLLGKFVPLPNRGTREFIFNPINTSKQDQELFRVDQTFGPSDNISMYGFFQNAPTRNDLPFTGADLPGFAQVNQSHTKQFVVSWNHSFSSRILNEARVGYTRLNFVAVDPAEPVLPSSVGFTGINPQNPAKAGIPVISITGLFTLGFSDNGPQPRIDQTYQVTDNFSWAHGRHTFKMGFEMRRFFVSNPFFFENGGHFDFAGSGPFSTGVSGADFLLGIPDAYTQSSGGFIDATAQQYYSYFQDQFKIRPNFTLTYGLGWQVDTPISDRFNKGLSVNCFKAGQQSKVFPDAPVGLIFPGDPGCNSAVGTETKFNHFGPRLGFAWSPDLGRLSGGPGKLAIRGGFGIYYNRGEEELTLQNLLVPPLSLIDFGIGDIGGTPSFANPFVDVTGTSSIPNKYPFVPPAPGSKVDFTFFEPFSLNVMDPNFTVPYSMNYHLTVEREVPSRIILSVGYVGAQARKLYGVLELNPGINPKGCAANPTCVRNRSIQNTAFPNNFRFPGDVFGSIGQQGTFGRSNYNSLQVSMKKAPTHGLGLLVSYTYSHSIDMGSSFENSGFGGSRRGQNPFDPRVDFADSEFDARHRLVVTYTYAIPSLKNLVHWMPSRLVEGWSFAGYTTLQTGFPAFVRDSGFRTLTCTSFEFYACWDNPNVIAAVQTVDPRNANFVNRVRNPANTTSLSSYWFNPNTFARAPFGVFGNARRDLFHGPGINQTNLSIAKETKFTERASLLLRLEVSNVFNHTQFLNPNGNTNSSNFGRILGARDARIPQITAKFTF
jgi:hypothetical protein